MGGVRAVAAGTAESEGRLSRAGGGGGGGEGRIAVWVRVQVLGCDATRREEGGGVLEWTGGREGEIGEVRKVGGRVGEEGGLKPGREGGGCHIPEIPKRRGRNPRVLPLLRVVAAPHKHIISGSPSLIERGCQF